MADIGHFCVEFEVNICGTRAIRVSKIVVEILRVFYNELCKLSNDFDKVIMHNGGDLCDSYDRRYIFKADVQRISISKKFLENMNTLISMIQTGDTLGNKLKSAMRLYYEIFMIYTMNLAMITLATISFTYYCQISIMDVGGVSFKV